EVERRQPVDTRRNHITRHDRTDTRGRTSVNQVARFEPDLLGQLRDDFGYTPDHLADTTVLALHTVDGQRDRAISKAGMVGSWYNRPARSRGIKTLAGFPG